MEEQLICEILMPSRSRIVVYLTEEKIEELKSWAEQENRPVSNLAATIILRALEERSKNEPPTSDTSSGGKGRG
jgi:hypothetical protein